MRSAFSTGNTNTLAVADLAGVGGLDDGLDGRLDLRVGQDDFDLDLGQEIHGVFAAAIDLGVAFLAAKPLTSVTVMPWMPISFRASLTSFSLNGLMMASIFFMCRACVNRCRRFRRVASGPGPESSSSATRAGRPARPRASG